jgi:hypothetical protein
MFSNADINRHMFIMRKCGCLPYGKFLFVFPCFCLCCWRERPWYSMQRVYPPSWLLLAGAMCVCLSVAYREYRYMYNCSCERWQSTAYA